MTQQQLADAVGTHVTHLSRLETGQRGPAGRDLLARLSAVLNAGPLLASASGRLPSHIEEEISTFPAAMVGSVFAQRTVPLLRRFAAVDAARQMLARTPGGGIDGAGRVDPAAVCRSLGFQPVIKSGVGVAALRFEQRTVVVTDPAPSSDPAYLPRTRFLLAHAAVHLSRGESACRFPRLDAQEDMTVAICCNLLCPNEILGPAFRAVLAEIVSGDKSPARSPGEVLWTAEAGRVVAGVASRLAVPGWVVMRRLADDALFDDEAFSYLDGDAP